MHVCSQCNGTGKVTGLIADKQPPAWKDATEKAFAELATLKDNWDSYGGRPIDPDHIAVARFVLEQIMRHDTPPPQVTPMSNGSVQLEWCRDGVDLEIEICNADVSGAPHVHYCHVLSGAETESMYPLEDIYALRGAVAVMSRGRS